MTNEEIKDIEGLIYKIAYSFTHDKYLVEDLFQQGVIGLLKAKKNFQYDKGAKLSSYAKMYIYGEMYNYFNKDNMTFKIGKDKIKIYELIKKTKELLTQEMKKEPSITDISKYLNISETDIYEVIGIMNHVLSINYEYEENNMLDFIKKEDDTKNIYIKELLDSLSDEERKVILYKYYEGYSQEEIAKMMNISQSSVSRTEAEGISKMRKRTLN